MSQELNLSILSQQTAAYTTLIAYANVTGLVITVPEDGNYDIDASYTNIAAGDNRGNTTRLAINGNAVNSTQSSSFIDGIISWINRETPSIKNISLKTGDVVSVQAVYVGSACTIGYVANTRESFLQITKVGV